MRSIVLALCAVMLLGVACSLCDAGIVRLEIRVDAAAFEGVDENERVLFIAGNFNGWDPGGLVCEKSGEGGGFTAEIETAGDGAHLEFKVARGSWATVEVDAQGRDIGNRTLASLPPGKDGGFVVHVEGFVDQRGTRWADGGGSEAMQSTVTGELEIWQFTSKVLDNSRMIRVWLPPGYNDIGAGRYPVLYMHDGQNLFDKATSFIGEEWGVDETCDGLIRAGEIPPMIVVGIDNAGGDRAQEYNPPYTQSDGVENWGDRYGRFVVEELMREINRNYRTKTGAANTSLGGSSYGGNITLYMATIYPDVFGRLLVESPAAWIQNEAIIDGVEMHRPWKQRVFIAVGTDESSDEGNDEAYIAGVHRMERALKEAGLGPDRLLVQVEEGAIHNETAWARRLPGALRFLFSKAPRE